MNLNLMKKVWKKMMRRRMRIGGIFGIDLAEFYNRRRKISGERERNGKEREKEEEVPFLFG